MSPNWSGQRRSSLWWRSGAGGRDKDSDEAKFKEGEYWLMSCNCHILLPLCISMVIAADVHHYVFLLCKDNYTGKFEEGEQRWLMSCNWRGQSSWIIGQRSAWRCDFPRHMKNMHIVQFTFILMCFSRYASYHCKIMHNRIALAYCNYSYNYSHTPNQSYAHAQRMSATMSFSPLQKNA